MIIIIIIIIMFYSMGIDAQVRRIRVVGSDTARHLGNVLNADKGPPVGIARGLETLPRHC